MSALAYSGNITKKVMCCSPLRRSFPLAITPSKIIPIDVVKTADFSQAPAQTSTQRCRLLSLNISAEGMNVEPINDPGVNKIRVLSNTYSYAVSDLEQFKQLLKISDDSFGCELPSKWKRALRFRTTDLKLFNQEVAQKPLHLSKLFRKVLNQEKKHKL
ncbi:hypothetical protein Y032_0301g1843 [Ancylostoma ceylanicum]|uniref:Uncharacterized protein n=1 Tax=Ancylostoma ceylanicum TaxID=53326 RepID=A0A016S4Z3_9BILA|nr:hypothetical protein Y032_0301g1843 [Ancylostoma ceylanicum]